MNKTAFQQVRADGCRWQTKRKLLTPNTKP
jgi:hypothetical protein